MRHIFVAEKFEQVRIGRLHDLTNHLCGFRFELVLVGRLNSHHRFPKWCVEQIVFGFALGNGGDGFLASLQSEAWRREAARKPRPHVRDLFAKIARDVAHLRDPVLVIRQRLERSPRGVAHIGPESRIRVRRHFVVTEFLIRDEVLDFGPINIVVDLLLRRELRARNIIELVQHILPVSQAHFLRRRIHFRQAIGNRFFDSFEPGKLLQPPFPFFCVDSSQPLICALRLGRRTRRQHTTKRFEALTKTRRSFTFYVAIPFTHSLVAQLTRRYPRGFAFYVAGPVSSIHYFE